MSKLTCQALSFGLFILILLFAPLAFGTVENWSFAVIETLTALAALLLFVPLYYKKTKFLEIPGLIPLLLFLGLVILQLIPLPAYLIKLFAPSTYEIYHPILELDPSNSFITLSLNRKATFLSLLTYTAYALVYFLTVLHLNTASKLKKTVGVVAVLGTVIALLAIFQKLTTEQTIYWLRQAPKESSPLGPWVYRNHFAGYMEMIFPLAAALSLYYKPQSDYKIKLRDRIVAFFTLPGANRSFLLATAAVMIAVSILLSLSRGGIVTVSVAFLFFTYISSKTTGNKRIHWAILLFASVALIISWFGWEPIIDEFGQLWNKKSLNLSGRMPIYLDTIQIIKEFPVFGTGAGTFMHVFTAFRSVYGKSFFDHTHSDYLEILSDCGITGFLLIAWFVFSILLHVGKKIRQRKDRYSILISSGAITGMLALLMHSLIDFQFYNGANGLYFFFLAGLAISGANTRVSYKGTKKTLLPKSSSQRYVIAIGIMSCLLLGGSVLYRSGIVFAQNNYIQLQTTYINPNLPPERLNAIYTDAVNLRKLDPLEGFYFLRQGDISSLLSKTERAQKEYIKACLLNPMSGVYIQQLSLASRQMTEKTTNALLALGIERTPHKIAGYLIYSRWLFHTGQQEKALAILHLAFLRVPPKTDAITRFILDRNPTLEEIEPALSPLPYAWHSVGKILEKREEKEKALIYYNRALEFINKENAKPDFFIRPCLLYKKQNDKENSLNLIRLGIEYFPDNCWFRVQLGNYYLDNGIIYRAEEEFRKAIELEPGNKYLIKKLQAIQDE